MSFDSKTVYAATTTPLYPDGAPFSPGQAYPEYSLGTTGPENRVYEAVRNLFLHAGLDAAHQGTRDWNPLRDIIHPGDTVLLKPNLVKELHPRDPEGWEYLVTHGSVIRAAADYVFLALGGSGRVVLADGPQTDSRFDRLAEVLGLEAIRNFYASHGLAFEIVDLRKEEWTSVDGVVVSRKKLRGDPAGYVAFDLGGRSELAGHRGAGRYYGADYDAAELNSHHLGGRHEYLVSRTAVEADVVFSLPKLKTHKKAGITVSLKNLVGINGDKNWLPHHTEGDPGQGGDEHPQPGLLHRIERRLVARARAMSLALPKIGPWLHGHARRAGRHVFGDTEEVVRSGNWWGNDTTWRMCLDLNKILLYGRGDGTLREDEPKRQLVLVDGIVAGQGSGPLNPDPMPAGLLLFGSHPPSVDAACAVLMGFDPDRIPIVRQAFRCKDLPLASGDWAEVLLSSSRPEWNGTLQQIAPESCLEFRPHFGWTGHIERRRSPTPSPCAGRQG